MEIWSNYDGERKKLRRRHGQHLPVQVSMLHYADASNPVETINVIGIKYKGRHFVVKYGCLETTSDALEQLIAAMLSSDDQKRLDKLKNLIA